MEIVFAIVVAVILVAVLIRLRGYVEPAAAPAEAGMFRQLCAALYPDFTSPNAGRDTTQTFRMLVAATVVFVVTLVVWATGAGLMHAGWVLSQPDLVPKWFGALSCEPDRCSWQLALFTLIQLLRAVGGVALLAFAFGLAGGFLGFLFGIPRRISEDGSAAKANGGSDYQLSTNLTQVSDWLTKVIVGVSLVEAKSAYGGFVTISTTAADWLFQGRHGSPAVVGAAIGGGAILGFLFFYLYTQLIVSRLIADAERALGVAAAATSVLLNLKVRGHQFWGLPSQIAPPIRRTLIPIERNETPPTAEEYEAAMAYYAVPFSDIAANPTISDEEIRSWARARALLDDYKGAVQGYFLLLSRRLS